MRVKFPSGNYTMCLSYLAPIAIPEDGIVDVDEQTLGVFRAELRGGFEELDQPTSSEESIAELAKSLNELDDATADRLAAEGVTVGTIGSTTEAEG